MYQISFSLVSSSSSLSSSSDTWPGLCSPIILRVRTKKTLDIILWISLSSISRLIQSSWDHRGTFESPPSIRCDSSTVALRFLLVHSIIENRHSGCHEIVDELKDEKHSPSLSSDYFARSRSLVRYYGTTPREKTGVALVVIHRPRSFTLFSSPERGSKDKRSEEKTNVVGRRSSSVDD